VSSESGRGKELDNGNERCRTGLETLGTAANALAGTVAGSTLVGYNAI